MNVGYQLSDSLTELSLEGISGRRTDRIRFRMISGTVAGFQAETITELSGGGVSIKGGGSSLVDKRQIKRMTATSAPIESANRRKCTLWLKADRGEVQIQFESDEITLREGHIVHVLCASPDGNTDYYLALANENTRDAYHIGGIPRSAILGFGAEPLVGLLFYAGASLVVALVLSVSMFGLAGVDGTAVLLIFFAFLGLRFFLWKRRQRVQELIQRRLGEIAEEVAEYVQNAGR